ncbi:homoserine dehydrogenase [Halalkalibacterium ligniniphilum]|uniref:homoserine dehydrogenase n=1 Tax=Halalkalibacterium ligniniphilum TaxID=1134413 RepID=UPI0003810283|nr:homoserine dehydrogenase [Halalkalibacterium ligniniphilum]
MTQIGIIGFGTVGRGVFERITKTRSELTEILGSEPIVQAILVKDRKKKRELDLSAFSENWNEFHRHSFDVVFEAMGGIEPAFDYVRYFLEKGVPVVTANKKLLAERGETLEKIAQEYGTYLAFEASVAGGIPIINAIKGSLMTTNVHTVSGILNGTTNYMVTEMVEHGRSFQDVLEEAQRLGYAEADPTDDIEGFDAWYKLRILSRLCFGKWPNKESIQRKGLNEILDWHTSFAQQLGLTLKLSGRASIKNGEIHGSVAPTFFTNDHPFSTVHGVTNAVTLEGKDIQRLLFIGPGAGKEATANSMIEDFLFHEHFRGKRIVPSVEQSSKKRVTRLLVMVTPQEVQKTAEAIDSLPCQTIKTIKHEEGEAWLLAVYEDVLQHVEDKLPITTYRIYGEGSIGWSQKESEALNASVSLRA